MGRDKATLRVGGELLWARQLRMLRELKPQIVWVSARSAPEWLPADVEVVLDTPPSRGPLSGIVATLARLQSSHLLALAIDLPSMNPDHLLRLLRLASPGCGVVPRTQEFLQPLSAIYPREAVSVAQAALASENCSLSSFVNELRKRGLVREYLLSPEEASLYHNVNTPEDLAG